MTKKKRTISKNSRSASTPKYTFCQQGRWWYFRHRLIGISRLRGSPDEPQFHRDYAEKLALVEAAKAKPAAPKENPHTLAWLINQYEKSPEYAQLAKGTRDGYEKLLAYAAEKIGDMQFKKLERRHIVVLRNSLSETPRTADRLVMAMSALYTWKIHQEDDSLTNPCHKIRRLQRANMVEGFLPWTEDQIEFYLKNCKDELRLAVLIGLHTGQRISDCVTMKTSQLTGGTITVVTSKTKEFIEISVHPELAEALEARPHKNAETFIVGKRGEPFKDSRALAHKLKDEMVRLGLPPLAFHGLRYAACGRLEDAGCTPYEVEDIVGHRTYAMARRRTREKVQSLLEKSAKSEN